MNTENRKKKLVVLTGAGISKESGIPTFRDADGMWENYPVMEVCSADGFRRNPALIHEFYNERRRQLMGCMPNAAHEAIVNLEKDYDVEVVTQNVDDLHERAGSHKVLHLHGELMKLRAIEDPDYVVDVDPGHPDSTPGSKAPNGMHLRPHIVFFQEPVPNIEAAVQIVGEADILVVIGTSLVVYPAAGLIHYARRGTPIYYIDPNPALESHGDLTVIKATATKGMEILEKLLAEKS